jgi:hypothetical protein
LARQTKEDLSGQMQSDAARFWLAQTIIIEAITYQQHSMNSEQIRQIPNNTAELVFGRQAVREFIQGHKSGGINAIADLENEMSEGFQEEGKQRTSWRNALRTLEHALLRVETNFFSRIGTPKMLSRSSACFLSLSTTLTRGKQSAIWELDTHQDISMHGREYSSGGLVDNILSYSSEVGLSSASEIIFKAKEKPPSGSQSA